MEFTANLNKYDSTTGFNIGCVRIYGLEPSVQASGLPLTEEYLQLPYTSELDKMERGNITEAHLKHYDRALRLGKCRQGTGHDCFLQGIIVQMNVTAPRYWWPELQRYHFVDFVSSMSTMHTIHRKVRAWIKHPELAYQEFSKQVLRTTVESYIDLAKSIIDLDGMPLSMKKAILKANLPEGYMQTARLTTNYRQLKTIYAQRKNHALSEWQTFCRWIEQLPMAGDLITGGESDDAEIGKDIGKDTGSDVVTYVNRTRG